MILKNRAAAGFVVELFIDFFFYIMLSVSLLNSRSKTLLGWKTYLRNVAVVNFDLRNQWLKDFCINLIRTRHFLSRPNEWTFFEKILFIIIILILQSVLELLPTGRTWMQACTAEAALLTSLHI